MLYGPPHCHKTGQISLAYSFLNSDVGRTYGYSGEPDGDFIQSLLRRNLNKLA